MAYYNGKEWVSSFTPYTPPAPKTTIKSDPEVLATQKMLKAAGYDPGPLDGINGPLTQAALSKYNNAKQKTVVKNDVLKTGTSAGVTGDTANTTAASTGTGTGTGTGLTQDDLDAAYNKMYGDLTSFYQGLESAKIAASIAALDKAKNNALAGLDTEKASIDPYYYDKRNQAAAQSDVGAMNFAQYMAGRGITGSAGALPEIYRNAGLQSQIGALNQQQAAEYADIERRRSGINSAYQSDVAAANAGAAADTMQNYINAMNTVYAQRVKDLAAQGKTSTGALTLEGKSAAQSDVEREAALVAQANYNDITAEINRRAAINPNDPLIPYLQAAAQKKLQDQQAAKAEADAQAWDNAMKLWPQLTNGATPEIAKILGVPVGAKAADYDIASMNAQTARINATKSSAKAAVEKPAVGTIAGTYGNNSVYSDAKAMKDSGKDKNLVIDYVVNSGMLDADVAATLSRLGFTDADIAAYEASIRPAYMGEFQSLNR